MSGLLKVLDGTPRGDKPFLCKTCQYAVHTKGSNSEENIICTYMQKSIRYKVIDCSVYHSRSDITLRAMEEIALVLVSKRGGREFGFERLSKLREEGKDIPPNAN